MTRFEVDAAAVAEAGASARASGAVIATEVAAMMRHLATLEASWHGSAASSFTALMAQWRGTQAQVEASLEQITLALDTAARQYSEAETSAIRMFAV
ncbi:conserved hypothetical protein [Beutenbergia cavernae DSM 12333]|uniref:ESAT-6-like protein n=1 Tax=Beutenbergia cavernae (strain ATCC BAA-8 / DSM 12333 / CCUG 43141 / JCM 11478 / NBRC 16432 / NCIMB 13614 / HKI 0122) TaxID=471853 RepID=C5BZC6_BEUC1|nr:WXG100 family type VII secretion target [Beutenbergia cavernae]ACQ79098.1 conserved hypothetical protein [Beutenbergia cavernae DSM 12333]